MTLTLNNQHTYGASQHVFAQRRLRALAADALSVLLVIFAAAALPLSAHHDGLLLLAGLAWLLAIPGNCLFQRRNWRCPVCNAPLWGREMRIDPLLSREPVDCMYCGAHLVD